MEETPMNPAPAQQPAAPMPEKKGNGGLIALIVLILLVIAAVVFWPKNTDQTPAPTTVGSQQQDQDLGSLEADLEATDVDGISDGL